MNVLRTKTTLDLTPSEYQDHDDSNDGYCVQCNAITRSGDTEPDAREYPCPDCNGTNCYGIQEALLMGKLNIIDGDDDAD